MILLTDENIDSSVVARLRAEGHQVFAVAEMDPGVTDDLVLALANAHNALLVTDVLTASSLRIRTRYLH